MRQLFILGLGCFFLAVLGVNEATATDRLVPSQYPTIQSAINAAAGGDVVIISPGTYKGTGNMGIDFMAKAITVRSSDPNNPAIVASTIIDCETYGSGISFSRGETTSSVLAGLTIINSYSTGIYCYRSSPSILNCTIRNNYAYERAAIYCNDSNAVISDCNIIDNSGKGILCDINSSPLISRCIVSGSKSTDYYEGHGIICFSGSPVITACIISKNGGSGVRFNNQGTVSDCNISENGSLMAYGGGISCGSNVSVTNCIISRNRGNMGGGILCSSGSPSISNCIISENLSVGGYSSGIYCQSGSTPVITGCRITGNIGTGIGCSGGSPTITKCIISGNLHYGVDCGYSNSNSTLTNCLVSENKWGAIIVSYSSNSIITNCAIVNNDTVSWRGGLYCEYSSTATVTNCILWGNTPHQIDVYDSNLPTITFSDIQGGYAGTGNIDSDPCFAFTNQFHLMAGSPCIDAGTNTPVGGLAATDLDGVTRPLDGDSNGTATADIGAYEYIANSPRLSVSPGQMSFIKFLGVDGIAGQTLSIRNSGGGTLVWQITETSPWLLVSSDSGESNGDINEIAVNVDTAGLAGGVYTSGITVSDGQQSVVIPVTLYVGVERNVPSQYATIQSAIDSSNHGDVVIISPGTYTGNDNYGITFYSKSITVRSIDPNNSAIVASTIVDCQNNSSQGFYFENFETNASVLAGLTICNGKDRYGSGIYCSDAGPTISNCIIRNNNATEAFGGGIFLADSNAVIRNCTISNNTAECGAGIYCGWGPDGPTITDCIIQNNSSTGYEGGGLFCGSEGSTRIISRCIISENTSYYGGSGIFCSGGDTIITDSFIINNVSTYGGGSGIHSDYSNNNITLVNCTIYGNRSNGSWYGNSAIYNYSTSALNITNSIIWGNSPAQIVADDPCFVLVTYSDVGSGWAGVGNIDSDPCFVAFYHLKPQSVCIDAGDPCFVSSATDIDGQARVNDGRVDMGADEYYFDDITDYWDLSILTEHWLNFCNEPYWCDGSDLNENGFVDFQDFAELAKTWLE